MEDDDFPVTLGELEASQEEEGCLNEPGFAIDSLEKLERFEQALTETLAETSVFARLGMSQGLLEYVPSLVRLARQQLKKNA